MTHFAVALLGRDRPGIVAEVTAILLEFGCNLEDVTTSILRGQFAMMLVCSVGEGASDSELEGRLRDLGRERGLMLSLWEVAEGHTESVPTHALTVYGPDRTGIVNQVAQVLAGRRVNICEMACRLRDGDGPLYVLTMEIEVRVDGEELERELTEALDAAGLRHSLREVGTEVL